jgi:hypothetical protein
LGKTQKELLRSLSGEDLLEWIAYDRINPYGEDRADLRSAIVATVINNSQGGKAKVKDFMPTFEPPKKQTAKDIANVFKFIAKAKGI